MYNLLLVIFQFKLFAFTEYYCVSIRVSIETTTPYIYRDK